MQKIKRFSTLESRIKMLVLFTAIVYTIFLLINQQIAISRIKNEIEKYANRIESISNENESFKENIARLNDLEHIEAIARKKLGLVRENEIVYIFSRD